MNVKLETALEAKFVYENKPQTKEEESERNIKQEELNKAVRSIQQVVSNLIITLLNYKHGDK